jgi:hypothetical protein
VAAGLQQAWSQLGGQDDELTRMRLRIAADAPSIWARVWQNNLRTEAVVVEALVATGVDPFEARVAAGAVLGGLMSALIDWGQTGSDEPIGERVGRAVRLLAGLTEEAGR